jgi:hypothetical protein
VKALGFIIFAASIAAFAYTLVRWRQRWGERQKASEARFAALVAQVRPPARAPALAAAPAAPAIAREERLLLDAAGKAGEAGEAALAIQLYAKLLSRFPQTMFAAQARAAVAEQKKKLTKS